MKHDIAIGHDAYKANDNEDTEEEGEEDRVKGQEEELDISRQISRLTIRMCGSPMHLKLH